MQKKGISAVITTVLLILLSIVAVIIVWQIVKGSIADSGTKLGATACTNIDVSLAVPTCSLAGKNATVQVTLNGGNPGTATGQVSKLKVIVNDGSGTIGSQELSGVGPASNNLPEQLGMRSPVITWTSASVNPLTVTAGASVRLEDGTDYVCGIIATKQITCGV